MCEIWMARLRPSRLLWLHRICTASVFPPILTVAFAVFYSGKFVTIVAYATQINNFTL